MILDPDVQAFQKAWQIAAPALLSVSTPCPKPTIAGSLARKTKAKPVASPSVGERELYKHRETNTGEYHSQIEIPDPDVEAFRIAWYAAAKIEPYAKPDPAVLKVLDKLAIGIRHRRLAGMSDDRAIKPFEDIVGQPEFRDDSWAALNANSFRDGDRMLIDVRIGHTASVMAFGPDGRTLSMPADLRWSYPQLGTFKRTGRLLLFDSFSIEAQGMRYGFHLQWLRRTPLGYVSAGQTGGAWTLNDGPNDYNVFPKGFKVEIHSLDETENLLFFSPDRLFRRKEIWDTHGPVARKVKVQLYDLDLRIIDRWISKNQGKNIPGLGPIRRGPDSTAEVSRGRGWIEVSGYDLRFYVITKAGQAVIRRIVKVR